MNTELVQLVQLKRTNIMHRVRVHVRCGSPSVKLWHIWQAPI